MYTLVSITLSNYHILIFLSILVPSCIIIILIIKHTGNYFYVVQNGNAQLKEVHTVNPSLKARFALENAPYEIHTIVCFLNRVLV